MVSELRAFGRITSLTLGTWLMCATAAYGATSESWVPDARAQGMGGAYTAIAEEFSAIWWNPGATGVRNVIGLAPYSLTSLQPELEQSAEVRGFSAYATFRGVGFSVMRTRVDYGVQPARDFSGNVIGTFRSTERTVLVGGGIEILQYLGTDTDRYRLGIGMSYKDNDVHLAPASVTRDGHAGSGSTWDIDLGVLFSYRLRPERADDSAISLSEDHGTSLELRGGISMINALDHTIVLIDPEQADPLMRRLRIGGALRARWWHLPPFRYVLQTTVSLERVSYHSGDSLRRNRFQAVERFGGEASLLGLLAGRIGYVNDHEGSIEDVTWGLGVGTDLLLGWPGRLGGRFDFASVPRADERAERIRQYGISFWFGF